MKVLCVGVLAVLALAAIPATAADPTAYTLATYYRCNETTEDRADAIFKESIEPLLKKQLEAGRFTAFGWSKHWLGGEWRRVEYLVGTDLDKLLDGRQAHIDALTTQQKKASDEFSGICTSHDDYLWSALASSQAPGEVARTRGAYGVSTYYECSSHEDEADAIVKAAYAPVLNQHVKDAKLVSWIWLRHMMGGKYRRALVLDTGDYKAAAKYWPVLGEALDQAAPAMAARFGEICHSHADYIWEMAGKK
jgi:hypothetical protein